MWFCGSEVNSLQPQNSLQLNFLEQACKKVAQNKQNANSGIVSDYEPKIIQFPCAFCGKMFTAERVVSTTAVSKPKNQENGNK